MTKSEKIKQSILETRKRRKSQTCKVYDLKLNVNKLSIKDQEHLKMLFVEAKWLYNNALASGDVFNYSYKIKEVVVLDKDRNEVTRKIQFLSSQMKQAIIDRLKQNIVSLSKVKKNRHGRLRFKSEVRSIPLQQYNNTYKFKHNKLRLQGLKKWIRIFGFDQIPKNAEFANATLVKKVDGIHLMVTTFLPKEEFDGSLPKVGIDFGIKNTLTLSTGEKFNVLVEEPESLKRLQRKLSRQRKGSNNWYKTKLKIQRKYLKMVYRKRDKANKIFSYLKRNFSLIGIQDESIKEWHQKWFGKQVQHSILGYLISKLKTLDKTMIVDRFLPSTKQCYICGTVVDISLDSRVFHCPNCHLQEDRDIKAAKTILLYALNRLVPPEQREFKPVEMNIGSSTKQEAILL